MLIRASSLDKYKTTHTAVTQRPPQEQNQPQLTGRAPTKPKGDITTELPQIKNITAKGDS